MLRTRFLYDYFDVGDVFTSNKIHYYCCLHRPNNEGLFERRFIIKYIHSSIILRKHTHTHWTQGTLLRPHRAGRKSKTFGKLLQYFNTK